MGLGIILNSWVLIPNRLGIIPNDFYASVTGSTSSGRKGGIDTEDTTHIMSYLTQEEEEKEKVALIKTISQSSTHIPTSQAALAAAERAAAEKVAYQ